MKLSDVSNWKAFRSYEEEEGIVFSVCISVLSDAYVAGLPLIASFFMRASPDDVILSSSTHADLRSALTPMPTNRLVRGSPLPALRVYATGQVPSPLPVTTHCSALAFAASAECGRLPKTWSPGPP